jgi:hypothetical protein
MKISFDSGWSSSVGRLSTRMGGTIFNQTVILPEYKFLLIGFPSYDKGLRGAFSWLAISAFGDER